GLRFVVRQAALVEHQLPLALAAPGILDGELQVLLAVAPLAGGVVQRLAPVEDLARAGCGRAERRGRQPESEHGDGDLPHAGERLAPRRTRATALIAHPRPV